MTTATKSDKAAKANKGLRAPQVRILQALAKSGKPLSRKEIAEKAPVDLAACVEYIGSADPAIRKANDVKHFPSLVSLGLVKEERHEGEPVTYAITAKGRKLAK